MLELGFQGGPGDALVAVLIQQSKAAVKFDPLRLAQRKLVLFETVLKLRNQRNALRRRQADNLIARKQFDALRVRKKARPKQRRSIQVRPATRS